MRHASSRCSKQAALVDDHGFLGFVCAALDLEALYLVHHVHPVGHAPERHVAVVRPPRVVLDGDEEPDILHQKKKSRDD